MTREVDLVRWATRVRKPPGGRALVRRKRKRGWGPTSNRFVDHTHRSFSEYKYKAWLLSYIAAL